MQDVKKAIKMMCKQNGNISKKKPEENLELKSPLTQVFENFTRGIKKQI